MTDSLILTFHGVGEPRRHLDADERQVWVAHEQFLSLLDIVAELDCVAITFDDGNSSDLDYALPALHERGLSATFFVVAGRIGKPSFLDRPGIRALADAGMEIGCHGMRHRPWRGLDRHGLHEELVEAKTVLEQVVGRPVTRASCPFGSYDRHVLRTVRSSGYIHVYSSDGGIARSTAFLQARNTVHPGNGVHLLNQIAAGERPLTTLRRRGKQAIKRWR